MTARNDLRGAPTPEMLADATLTIVEARTVATLGVVVPGTAGWCVVEVDGVPTLVRPCGIPWP